MELSVLEGVEFHSATRFGDSDMTMMVKTLCDGVLIDSLIDWSIVVIRYLHIIPIGLAWAQRERLQREAAAHHALAQMRVHKETRKQADDGESVGSSSRRGAWTPHPAPLIILCLRNTEMDGRIRPPQKKKKKRGRTRTEERTCVAISTAVRTV